MPRVTHGDRVRADLQLSLETSVAKVASSPPPSFRDQNMNSNQEESRKTSNGLLSLLISARLPLLLGFHLVVFTGVLWIAFLMRFTMNVPAKYVELFCSAVLPVVATKLVVFYYLRSFHGWWRYVHFSDLVSLVKSSAVASLACLLYTSPSPRDGLLSRMPSSA